MCGVHENTHTKVKYVGMFTGTVLALSIYLKCMLKFSMENGKFLGGCAGSEVCLGDSLLLEGKSLLKVLVFAAETGFNAYFFSLFGWNPIIVR